MNATHAARQAYSSAAAPIRTDRGAEYEAFASVTRKLQSAAGGAAKVPHAMVEAVHLNRRLWQILATDVADDANMLPDETRAAIISLYEFVRTHSSAVLRREAGVQSLIEINAAIMRGLNSGGAQS